MIKWIKDIIYDLKYDNFIKILFNHGFEKLSRYEFIAIKPSGTYKFNIKTKELLVNGKIREFSVQNYMSYVDDPYDLDKFLYRNLYHEPNVNRMTLVK